MANEVATGRETLEALLESRRTAVPFRRSFVQAGGAKRWSGPGPLSWFVKSHHLRALDLYLLFHAIASAPPFNVTRDSRLWGRALGLGDGPSTRRAISKYWAWLAERRLIERHRVGRTASPLLLVEDGSGREYTHPGARREPYFQLPYAYWREEWDMKLDLPAKALLLIALSLPNDFVLPIDKAAAWYGISRDTAGRGLSTLQRHELLRMRYVHKKAPLAPLGYTYNAHYTLRPPFGPQRKRTAG